MDPAHDMSESRLSTLSSGISFVSGTVEGDPRPANLDNGHPGLNHSLFPQFAAAAVRISSSHPFTKSACMLAPVASPLESKKLDVGVLGNAPSR